MVFRPGVGLASVALLLLPQTVLAAPGTPTNLTSSVVNQAAGGIVTLAWNLGPGEATSTIVVEAGSSRGTSNIGTFDVNPISPLVVTAPSGTYYVRIRGRNANGLSGPSNEVVIVVGGAGPCSPPGAPSNLSFSISGTTVTLTWAAGAGASSYVVSVGSSASASNILVFDTGTPANSLTANAAHGVFYVRVTARNACGTSVASNEVVITIGGATPVGVEIISIPNPVPWGPGAGHCDAAPNTWSFTVRFTETAGVGVAFTGGTHLLNGVTTFEAAGSTVLAPRSTSTRPTRFCLNSPGPHTLRTTYRGTDANGVAVSVVGPTIVLLAPP